MLRQTPVLQPAPRHLVWGSGLLTLPGELPVVLRAFRQELLPAAERFQAAVSKALGITVSLGASPVGVAGVHVLVAADDSVAHEQGYRLSVGAGRLLIEARSPQGAAYGLATLKQLLLTSGRQLQEVTIQDYPDFERRGVMLDISRGKVPTMERLFRFVDLLADLKVNEFQLYTEHTFAYRNHREVWQNFSPMTGEQILLLDRYCRERFIDLVPNQNSFGHMHTWLKHERYQHMAEVLDGFDFPWGTRHEGPFSLCPLEESVPGFLAELYDELLPHFSSRYFNVGCDETFDLGQGRSKEAVAQHGEHRVYLDLLLQIHQMVAARGKSMMFWGDIINKAPEFISELPKEQIIALEWGYEASHPFDEKCGNFARAGIPFYVCPGTSTWNSLVGRTENAVGNLRSAAENGLKHGAIGYLNTIWGDRGHQDYEPVSYLPVAYGAGVSWAYEANREADVRPFLNRLLFGDRSGQIGELLSELGNVYKVVGVEPPNGSLLCYLLHFGLHGARGAGIGLSPEAADRTAGRVRELAARIGELELTCPDGALVLRELESAVRMLLHACEFGKLKQALIDGAAPDRATVKQLLLDIDEIIATHRQLWLERNRLGGLEEMGLAPFRKLQEGYRKLLAE